MGIYVNLNAVEEAHSDAFFLGKNYQQIFAGHTISINPYVPYVYILMQIPTSCGRDRQTANCALYNTCLQTANGAEPFIIY